MIRKGSADSMSTARLLLKYLDLLTRLDRSLPVLDLACGTGRNGLMLAQHGIPIVFADKSVNALQAVEQCLCVDDLPGRTWHIDLEVPGASPFSNQQFSAIINTSLFFRFCRNFRLSETIQNKRKE